MTSVETSIIPSSFPSYTYSPEQTVLAIREMAREGSGEVVDTNHFHLAPCVCGVPMWQQPCLICHYYPYSSEDNTDLRRKCRESVRHPRDAFIAAIERAGNIAVWYVGHWRRSCAWKPSIPGQQPGPEHMEFRRGIEKLEERARAMPCAPPGKIFDTVLWSVNDPKLKSLPRYHSEIRTLQLLAQRDLNVSLSRYQARDILRLVNDEMLDDRLDVTDKGRQTISDYALEFLK